MAASSGALHFRFRLGPTLATLAGLAVLLALGTWQLERLEWKRGLIAARTAQLAAPPEALPLGLPATADAWRAWDFRKVETRGRFRHDQEQLFGASTYQGRLGHHVLTPLLRPDGSAVLIDRGWVPADRTHPATRREGQIADEVAITGIARYRGDDRPGWFTPDNRPAEAMWYWYDLGALEAALGRELLPIVVEADATPNPGGLPVGGQTRTELVNNHLQYAITWYGLAAGLLAVYIAFSLKRGEAG